MPFRYGSSQVLTIDRAWWEKLLGRTVDLKTALTQADAQVNAMISTDAGNRPVPLAQRVHRRRPPDDGSTGCSASPPPRENHRRGRHEDSPHLYRGHPPDALRPDGAGCRIVSWPPTSRAWPPRLLPPTQHGPGGCAPSTAVVPAPAAARL